MTENQTKISQQLTSDQLPEITRGYTYQVPSPNTGNIYVIINEDEKGNPVAIFINIGKSGSEAAAWANATSRLLTRGLLNKFLDLAAIVQELSQITSDRSIRTEGLTIRSGVEAVVTAIMRYQTEKVGGWIQSSRKTNANIGYKGRL